MKHNDRYQLPVIFYFQKGKPPTREIAGPARAANEWMRIAVIKAEKPSCHNTFYPYPLLHGYSWETTGIRAFILIIGGRPFII